MKILLFLTELLVTVNKLLKKTIMGLFVTVGKTKAEDFEHDSEFKRKT